jgi:hypothetical protein
LIIGALPAPVPADAGPVDELGAAACDDIGVTPGGISLPPDPGGIVKVGIPMMVADRGGSGATGARGGAGGLPELPAGGTLGTLTLAAAAG